MLSPDVDTEKSDEEGIESSASAIDTTETAAQPSRVQRSGFWAALFLYAVHLPLFGGLFSHFEDWSFAEGHRFAGVVASTIGYGNIVPVTDEGKLLVISCGITGIPLILAALDWVGKGLLWLIEIFLQRMRKRMLGTESPVSHQLLFAASICLLSMHISQAILLYRYMEEGWTWLDSTYYVFNMMSTIGLGDFVPAVGNPATWYVIWHTANAVIGLAGIGLIFALLQEKWHKTASEIEHKSSKHLNFSDSVYTRSIRSVDAAQTKLKRFLRQRDEDQDPILSLIADAIATASFTSTAEDVFKRFCEKSELQKDDFVDSCRRVLHLTPASVTDDELRSAFQRMDLDSSGTLELMELVMMLEVHHHRAAASKLRTLAVERPESPEQAPTETVAEL